MKKGKDLDFEMYQRIESKVYTLVKALLGARIQTEYINSMRSFPHFRADIEEHHETVQNR